VHSPHPVRLLARRPYRDFALLPQLRQDDGAECIEDVSGVGGRAASGHRVERCHVGHVRGVHPG
jgi:hypothetical protein